MTLTGENDFLRGRELRRIVDGFVAEHTDMGLERLDGEEVSYERMREAVQSLPFLAPRKLVILRTPGANKQFAENIEQFLDDVAETNDVVLVESKLDKRLGYYKFLKKLTDFREFPQLDGGGLAKFLAEYVSEQGGSMSLADARLLIERAGANQQLLMHELDKLLAYNSNITRETIELLSEKTPQSSIFELLDAAFAGNEHRTFQLYDEQRALKVEPQQIIAMLAWQLHTLALAKTARNRSAADVAREAGMSPFVVNKSMRLAQRIPLARLKALVTGLREFDERLKREPLSADEAVRYYLLTLVRQ